MCIHLIKTTVGSSLARLATAEKKSFDTVKSGTDDFAGQSRLWLFMFNYRAIILELNARTNRLGWMENDFFW
jgi:hypothetical protein